MSRRHQASAVPLLRAFHKETNRMFSIVLRACPPADGFTPMHSCLSECGPFSRSLKHNHSYEGYMQKIKYHYLFQLQGVQPGHKCAPQSEQRCHF